MKEPDLDQMICDFCSSGTGVCWGWRTPNIASSMQEAKEKGVFWAEDEVWYACDTCHRQIIAGKRESLLQRGINANSGLLAVNENGVYEKIDASEVVTRTHNAFWEYNDGTYERLEK